MVSPIAIAAISFLSKLGGIIFRVAGGRDVPRVASGNHIIVNLIDKAQAIEQHRPLAQRAASNFENFDRKLSQVQNVYDDWNDANDSYESTLDSISTYRRELIRARRARNQSRIDMYTELLDRANQTRQRRKTTLDSRYNTLIDRLEELAEIAGEVLEDKEELEDLRL